MTEDKENSVQTIIVKSKKKSLKRKKGIQSRGDIRVGKDGAMSIGNFEGAEDGRYVSF